MVNAPAASTVSKTSGFTLPKSAPEAAPPRGDEEAAAESSDADPEDDLLEAAKPLTYEERLKKFGVSVDEALKIIDALATVGKHSETVQVSPSIKVRFSTRTLRFNSYLAEVIDLADPKKVGRMNQLMTEYQMAASLDAYGENVMPSLDQDMPEQKWRETLNSRLEIIKKIPSPLFVSMCTKLAKFDAKMLVILSDGYEENF